jgi:hypothetical protein
MLDKVKIGAVDYQVVEVENLVDGVTVLNGHILYNESVIKLEQNMSVQQKDVTLWHEIIHGILTHAGFSNHNEKMVEALGYGVLMVLRDNPGLIDQET